MIEWALESKTNRSHSCATNSRRHTSLDFAAERAELNRANAIFGRTKLELCASLRSFPRGTPRNRESTASVRNQLCSTIEPRRERMGETCFDVADNASRSPRHFPCSCRTYYSRMTFFLPTKISRVKLASTT